MARLIRILALDGAWQAARDKERAWCEALDAALALLPETAEQLKSPPSGPIRALR